MGVTEARLPELPPMLPPTYLGFDWTPMDYLGRQSFRSSRKEGKIIRGKTMTPPVEKLKNGFCKSIPELLPDGRIRLHETWEWTYGGDGTGESIVEEIKT